VLALVAVGERSRAGKRDPCRCSASHSPRTIPSSSRSTSPTSRNVPEELRVIIRSSKIDQGERGRRCQASTARRLLAIIVLLDTSSGPFRARRRTSEHYHSRTLGSHCLVYLELLPNGEGWPVRQPSRREAVSLRSLRSDWRRLRRAAGHERGRGRLAGLHRR
jgi:hypothetical protein